MLKLFHAWGSCSLASAIALEEAGAARRAQGSCPTGALRSHFTQEGCAVRPLSLDALAMRTRFASLLLLDLGLSRPWAPL